MLPGVVLGPPRGGGCCAGSTDVCSLGHGGWIVLEAEGNAIVDGPGADLVVFENPFWIGGDETRPYVEPGRVSVSDDGVTWHAFDCAATAAPYMGCAGVSPVHANGDTGGADPLDPTESGGDAFDLSTLGLQRARYVRVEDVDTDSAVFDLDAIAIVNAECP
ncbi:MAG: hypothetical protein IT376_08855 [Polyangiaceae bacterium]|nr:hypothetical protein [Polyangiaceae bacterium]